MIKRTKPGLSNLTQPPLNYLILIVSFTALACLSIGITASSRTLEAFQRWLVITFLILFGISGLFIGIWLILRQPRRISAAQTADKDIWKVMLPENQQAKLNREAREIAATLKIPEEQFSDLVSAYIVAGDLALREIQQESQTPLLRYVRVDNAEFDAVLLKNDCITCIEFVFLVQPNVAQERIDLLLKKIETAKKAFQTENSATEIKLLLVLITQLEKTQEAELRSKLAQKFMSTPVDVDIRLLDFEHLQKIYAIA